MSRKGIAQAKGVKCGVKAKVRHMLPAGITEEIARKHRLWLAKRGYSAAGVEFGAGSEDDLRYQRIIANRQAALKRRSTHKSAKEFPTKPAGSGG